MNRSQQLRSALVLLHRRKSADYGNAWKKRGEVLSILANIARKVDRLEAVADRQVLATDESLVDTLADLLVYCVKYQTYLADQDTVVAAQLGLTGSARPFSDGVAGFEQAFAHLSLAAVDVPPHMHVQGIPEVVKAFATLEGRFSGMRPTTAAVDRLKAVTVLLEATIGALGQVAAAQPHAWHAFVLPQE